MLSGTRENRRKKRNRKKERKGERENAREENYDKERQNRARGTVQVGRVERKTC